MTNYEVRIANYGLIEHFGCLNDRFVSCVSGYILRFSPMHHEKYVLIVLRVILRSLESMMENNSGFATPAIAKLEQRSEKTLRRFGQTMLMASKPTNRSDKDLDAARNGCSSRLIEQTFSLDQPRLVMSWW